MKTEFVVHDSWNPRTLRSRSLVSQSSDYQRSSARTHVVRYVDRTNSIVLAWYTSVLRVRCTALYSGTHTSKDLLQISVGHI